MNKSVTSLVNIVVALSLSACATSKFKVSKAPPPGKITVAVKKFSTAGYNSKSKEDQGLADFEAIYLPTRLIESLNRTGGVSKAYFTMGETPSTDFVVAGDVVSSDGKRLSIKITLTRVDGAKIWEKSFRYDLGDTSEAAIHQQVSAMWNQIASEVDAARTKTDINLPEARAFAYAENPALSPNENLIKDAGVAGGIERDRILAPLSNTLVPRANIASKYYCKWQRESVPFVTQKAKAASDKATADMLGFLGAVAGGLNAVASVQAAQAGNVQAMQLGQQGMLSAQVVTEQAAADSQVAQNQINELQAQLANLKRDFAIGSGRQITVTIYGKVVSLHGTQEEMLKQFREVVKDKINKQSVPPTPDKPKDKPASPALANNP